MRETGAHELFTLLREVNDAETMKYSQLRHCIDKLEKNVQAIRQESAAITEEIIDRLIADEFQKGYSQRFADEKKYADRAVPEPDADAVEAAAKALHERHWADSWDSEEEEDKRYYREDARAALQAAARTQKEPQR